MSLDNRIAGLDNLGKRFPHTRCDNLLLEYQVPIPQFYNLQAAAAIYLSACLGLDHPELHEIKLLQNIEHAYPHLRNITPNGMVVPKKDFTLEYNLLVQAFSTVIRSCNIYDLIISWHVPLNLRIKLGTPNLDNLRRNHPTEEVHSDSWAGESSASVTTHLPIFGDSLNNGLKFFTPPPDFKEEWLGPRSSYRDGREITQRYKEIPHSTRKGYLYFQDFAGLHGTHRNKQAGTRISIDTTFVLKRPQRLDGVEHQWRTNERASADVLDRIGSDFLFSFADGLDDRVDNAGGFKHPSNARLICLNTDDDRQSNQSIPNNLT